MSKYSELLGVKVQPEVKEKLNELTEKAKETKIIDFNGDIYNLAAELLEKHLFSRHLYHAANLEEVEYHTSRIVKAFVNAAEQHSNLVEKLNIEHGEKFENAKITIEGLLSDKNELTKYKAIIEGLTKLTKVNLEELGEKVASLIDSENELEKANGRIEEQLINIKTLNSQNEAKDIRIKELERSNQQVEELTETVDIYKSELEEQEEKLQQVRNELVKQKEQHEKAIDNLNFAHEKALFAKEREVSEGYNKRIEELQARYAAQLAEEVAKVQERYEERLSDRNTQLQEQIRKINSLEEALNNSEPKKKGNREG